MFEPTAINTNRAYKDDKTESSLQKHSACLLSEQWRLVSRFSLGGHLNTKCKFKVQIMAEFNNRLMSVSGISEPVTPKSVVKTSSRLTNMWLLSSRWLCHSHIH
jgi:hypothetical protein